MAKRKSSKQREKGARVDLLALRRALGARQGVSFQFGREEFSLDEGVRGGLLSPTVLARIMGCSSASIARWERGAAPGPKFVEAIRRVEKVAFGEDKDDVDDMLLAANPRFWEMIERSRRSGRGMSTDEVRRHLGLKPRRRRRGR